MRKKKFLVKITSIALSAALAIAPLSPNVAFADDTEKVTVQDDDTDKEDIEDTEDDKETEEETEESTFADVISSLTENTTETPSEPEPVSEPVPEKKEEKKDIVSEILRNNNIEDEDGSLKESASEGMEDSEFLKIMKSITKTQKVKNAAEQSAKLKEQTVKDRTKELDKSLKNSITNKGVGAASKKVESSDEIEDRKREAAHLRELEEEKQRKLEEKRKLREERKGKGINLFKKK